MGQIYSDAATVIVWLGPGPMGMTGRLASFINGDIPASHDRHQLDGQFTTFEHNLDRHTYFSRLWIIQEVLLARRIKVLVGTFSISWTGYWRYQRDVHHRVAYSWPDLIGIGSQFDPPEPGTPEALWDCRNAFSPAEAKAKMPEDRRGMNMYQLIHTFHMAKCSDTKDFIYAFLWLTPLGRSFKVDYKEDAFYLVARACHHFGAGMARDLQKRFLVLLCAKLMPHPDIMSIRMPPTMVSFVEQYLPSLSFTALRSQCSESERITWTLAINRHFGFDVDHGSGSAASLRLKITKHNITEQAVKLANSRFRSRHHVEFEVTALAKNADGMASVIAVIWLDGKDVGDIVLDSFAGHGEISFSHSANTPNTRTSSVALKAVLRRGNLARPSKRPDSADPRVEL